MAKCKDVQPNSENTTPGEQTPSAVPHADGAENSAMPSSEPTKMQSPSAEPPKVDLPPPPMPKVESPRIAPEMPKAHSLPPPPPPPKPEQPARATAPEPPAAIRTEAPARSGRFALLAASVAIAAALGSTAGALGASSFGHFWSQPAAVVGANNLRGLQEMVAGLGSELASIKANLEATNRLNGAQFTRLGEKLDRAERAQSEPSARIAKIAEMVERLERRPANASAAAAAAAPPPPSANEATGSVAGGGLAVGKSAIVEGWTLLDIYRGRALVEGRSGMVFEVGPGSNIPGLGRVENITRQDGRWIVVTPKGLIVSMR